MSTPPPASTGHGTARVLLYGRPGCHLCDDARAVVGQVCDEAGQPWAEIDLDAPTTDPALRAEYGDYVPVVTVDGVQQGFWRVDARRLARAVGRISDRGPDLG
ncbi:glutaredoxin family protein [Cellulosimicrobium arenosum]|uniref:Glutaredoxin family protein n=1 Tax=Cellulosimicrobium arenosum TaxID=2708133 RepID=A0A927J097_9MICO|nr:glutaredoxin family protein [Cellulosimicrobium arenosum]MBD8079478.1 glutaredoxin family protein [Cellulosimicrobium arenosum]